MRMVKALSSCKPLTVLILLYGGLLFYASLMPYDFTAGVDYHRLFQVKLWDYWPFNMRARTSGSDFVSNLVLYIPLGFLLSTRFRCACISRFRSCVLSLLICSGLSLGVEILQGLTISRIPSATDWLLNSISGLLGATVGVTHGQVLWEKTISWLHRRWQNHPLDILTLVYIALLTADALSPFLPTILLSQVSRNLKHSHFNVIEGLAQHPWHWWLITQIMVYMILTCLLATWGATEIRHRAWGRAMFWATIVSLGLELSKLMIVSRFINLANVFTAISGVGLVTLLGPVLTYRLGQRQKLDLAILALLVYEFYLAWTPFNFTWDTKLLHQKLPSIIELLPFYHYAMGGSLNHVRLFVQGIVLQGILIYLVRIRFFWLAPCQSRLVLMVAFAGLLGFLQEGGQMLLPSRTPSMTDVYCFMIGAAGGAWLPRIRHHTEGSL